VASLDREYEYIYSAIKKAAPKSGHGEGMKLNMKLCYFLLRHAANPIPAIPVPRKRREEGSGIGFD
jgi:hypothetical protein